MSGLYFDVFPADDPNGTALGELTEAYDKQYQGVHQAIGSGQFTINRDDAQAAWAVADNLVRVRRASGGPFAYDDARYIGAFWIESGKRVLLSSDEEGGRDLTMGGRTPEAALRWAILYPDAFDSRNDVFTDQTRVDGNWHIPDRTAGEVLTIFLRDLDDRSPDPLPFISRDFTVNYDSTGTPWSDTDTDWAIPVGTNGLDLLATCVSGGLFYRVDPDFAWHAYEDEPGDDLSGSITITEGERLATAADQDVAARETVGRVLVQGTKQDGKLKYREVVNATVEGDLPGRREGFVEYRRTPTNAKLDQAGNRYIRKSKRRHDGPLQLAYVEDSGREAFTDFVPGDIITVDIPGYFDSAALRVYAISLEEDAAGNVTPVVDFEQSPFDPNQGDAEFDDGNGDGSNCGDCPPLPPYVPNPHDGPSSPTTGGILYDPGNNAGTPPATLFQIEFGSDGDNPSPGHSVRALDTANFAYLGTYGNETGFKVLAATAVLDLAVQISFIDAGGTRTFTAQLRKNGGTIATDAVTLSGLMVGFLNINVSDLACVANDELEVFLATSDLAGVVVPWGVGDATNRFEILDSSTVGGTAVTPDPLDGQDHAEELAGDGSTTEFQTNFPYAPGSLQVHVNGLLWPVTETDPTTGTFTFDSAPPADAVIIATYQNAGTTGTGATNPVPTASTPTGGGTSVTAKDEGSNLTTALGSIDFVGAGVTATVVGDDVTVTIPGGSGHDDDWFWAVDYGVVADGTTDDTAAMQAVIDACSAAGGGTIRLPAGIIQIDGALVSTSTFNSQLTIPLVLLSSGMSVPIRFLGAGPNRIYDGTPGDHETIIRSSWNGTISGHPAVISAGTWRDLSTGRNNTQLRFEDITFVAHDDPKLSMLQLTSASIASFRNVQVRTTTVQPSGYATHSNAVAIEFPFGLSYANEETANVAVYGFYTGARVSEQTKGYMAFAFCKVGVELIAQQNTAPYIRWPNFTFYWTFVSCDTGILTSGTGDRWVSGHASFEHDEDATPSWATTWDINDNDNILHGIVTVHPTDYTDGPTDDLRVNNAQKLSYHWPSQDFWRLHSQVHIPTGTDPSANPYSGFTLYAKSADDHPYVRLADGTTHDLLSSTLSDVDPLPDATVADPGVDTEASRSDHVHPTSSSHDTDGLISVEPYDTYGVAGTPPVVTITTKWGISAGVPYYDSAGAVSGEEAALYYNPAIDEYVLVAYGF